MVEKFDKKGIETPRESLIKARASLDAYNYINLMKKKSPRSLKLQPDGRLEQINLIEAQTILNTAKLYFNPNLDLAEMLIYTGKLMEEVEKILSKKTKK